MSQVYREKLFKPIPPFVPTHYVAFSQQTGDGFEDTYYVQVNDNEDPYIEAYKQYLKDNEQDIDERKKRHSPNFFVEVMSTNDKHLNSLTPPDTK